MRVAVAQFATSLNKQENLANCLRIIDNSAECEPDLIVLPELCNTQFCHVQPCYSDHNHAWSQAEDTNGDFLQSIAGRAITHECYIVVNVSLRRELKREHQDSALKSNISITSCLFSPQGKLIQKVNKQSLLGHENHFFTSEPSTAKASDILQGKLGLLVGSDDQAFEGARDLALGGAQIICHSMSSFALDQSTLFAPTRASENRLFYISANKVGALMSEGQSAGYAEQNNIPQHALSGVGQSQIISPDGEILAQLTDKEEGFVFADIELGGKADKYSCGLDNKKRPDGTFITKQRRPELYHFSKQQDKVSLLKGATNVPSTANVAIFATYKSNEQAIEDVCHYIEQNLTDIIQLPELFFIADKTITHDAEQRRKIESLSQLLIKKVSDVLQPLQYVCTSLIIEGAHQAVVINEQGIFASQKQLHFCQRYNWTLLGDDLNIVDLPLEQGNIKLAMLTADDANIAEIVNVAALQNIHLLLVPFDIQQACEVEMSLLSRAAENRICIVAASREKSFEREQKVDTDNPFGKNKVKKLKSTGLIINLPINNALLPQWQPRKFNGHFNQPIVKQQFGKITKAVIHPIAADQKDL